MTSTRTLLALLCVPLLGGCLEDLPPAYLLDTPRVLGVRAEPPEVAPGDQVELTALTYSPDGTEPTLTWHACLIPERGSGIFGGGEPAPNSGGGGYGLDEGSLCYDIAATSPDDVIALGEGKQVTLEVPADLLDDKKKIAALYGLPADSQFTALALDLLILPVAGVNLTISLRADFGTETIDVYKRLNVSTATEKNTSPTDLLFRLEWDTLATTEPKTGPPPKNGRCFAGEDAGPLGIKAGRHRVTVMNIPDPPPTYPVLVLDTGLAFADPATMQGTGALDQIVKTQDETLFYSFFTTKGELDRRVVKSRGNSWVVWTLEDADLADGTVPFWVVVRDARGGLSWCHSELTAEK